VLDAVACGASACSVAVTGLRFDVTVGAVSFSTTTTTAPTTTVAPVTAQPAFTG
jgi:hypothetical protein